MARPRQLSAFAVREATKETFDSEQKKQVVQNPEKRRKRKQKKLKVLNRSQLQQASQASPGMRPAAKYRKLELSANSGQPQREAVLREPAGLRSGSPAVLPSATINGNTPGASSKKPKGSSVRMQDILKASDGKNGEKKKQTSTTVFEKDPVKQPSAARKQDKVANFASPRFRAPNAARKRKASSEDEDEPPVLVYADKLEEEAGSQESAESSASDCCNECQPMAFSDSENEARELLASLLQPVSLSTFFDCYWTKQALHVSRKNARYYNNILPFSTRDLDYILRMSDVQFGTNIDITSYENFERQTHNPSGRARGPIVWDMYKTGCSVRLLNPQTYHVGTWRLLSTLQELFGSGMGANVYLTPPNSQGFAPHYDDIEAFVLQLEGKKRWRVYRSRSPNEELPRFSSPNFTQEELGDPVLDCVLKQGDLLYFPRGAIHQANTVDNCHSLHITVSTHQTNTFADLFEKMLKVALERASRSCKELRESLPLDYLNYTGAAITHKQSPGREKFVSKVKRLFGELKKFLPLDEACDEMGKQFIQNCLPPYVTSAEAKRSVFGSGEYWDPSRRHVRGAVELEPTSKVRLLRKHIVRMAIEPVETADRTSPDASDISKKDNLATPVSGDSGKESGDNSTTDDDSEKTEDERAVLKIYHYCNNDRLPLNRRLQCIEASPKVTPVIVHLIQSYPNFVAIEDFPLDDLESKMDIAYVLYDAGILILENIIDSSDEGDSTSEDTEISSTEEEAYNDDQSGDGQSHDDSDEKEGDVEEEEEDDEEEEDEEDGDEEEDDEGEDGADNVE